MCTLVVRTNHAKHDYSIWYLENYFASAMTKKLFFWIAGIVQDTAFSENSKLQGISKYNAETMENLTSTIAESDEEKDGQFELVRYLCGILVEEGINIYPL